MALTDHFTTRIGTTLRASRFSPATYLALWRSRRALARLDSRALEDIGISGKAAQREARRGVWDVPDNWKNN